MQTMKRTAVNDFMLNLSGDFAAEYLYSGDDTEISPGFAITPLDKATTASVRFLTHPDRFWLLQSDTEERFVPKLLWTAAITGACYEDGSEDYTRVNLCGALIAHAILDLKRI